MNRLIIGFLILFIGLVATTSAQQGRIIDTVGPGMPDYLKTNPAKYWRHFASRPRQVSAAANVLRAANSSTFHTLGAFTVTYNTTPATCGDENGSVVLLPSGGTAPYTYSFEGQPYQSSAFWIEFGGYTFSATVKDATGATVTVSITIPNTKPEVYVMPVANGSPVVGCDLANGTITLQGSGGVPPYSYSVDQVNWQTSPNFTNLPPGDYTFFIKDAEGCIGQFWSPLGDGAACGNDGYEVGSGGYSVCGAPSMVYCTPLLVPGPLQYSIDGGTTWQSNPDFIEYAGQYDITIKDGNGKLYLYRCFVYSDCPMMVNISTQDATCGNSDGQLTVNASNGTPPYQFSIDGIHFQSGSTFTGLAAGTYSVVAMDAGGAVRLYSGQIINSGCPVLSATATNATCGNNNGSITASVTGGVSPYSYSRDGGPYQGSPTFGSLGPGIYLISVKDLNGNTSSINVTVGNTCLQLTATPGNTVCSRPDGSITITGSGGTPPYAYSRDMVNYQSSNVFSGLGAGTYTVYIKDAAATISGTGVTITDQPGPTSMTVTPQAAGCDLTGGGLTVSVAGGTAPYQYSIDGVNWQVGSSFALSPGSYPVEVKDVNGCGLSNGPWTVAVLCLKLAATWTDASCTLDDGSITASASGGTAPYAYSLDGITFQSSPVFTARPPGSYTVTAKDNGGLSASVPITVGSVCLDLALTTADATCADGKGVITAAVSSGTAPYTFSLDGVNWQPGNSFSVSAGTYTVMAKDANGFSVVSQPAHISFVNSLSVDAGADHTICQGNAVRLNAVYNGTAFYWTPTTGLDDATALAPQASPAVTTLYTLTASLGVCQASATVTIHVDPAPVANAGQDTAICYGQSVQLKGSGGVAYAWSPGTYLNNAGIDDPVVTRPTENIVYSLTVTDALGCRSLQPDQVAVTVTPPPAISLSHDTAILADQPVYLDVQDVNNSGFSVFAWSPADGLSDPTIANPVATVGTSITYTVVAATPNGCEATASVAIKVYSVSGLFVPNAFTPNGDGHNDVLRVIPVGIRELNYFTVFNRWGQRVFATQRAGEGWDGRVNGVVQSAGTYVWMAGGINYKGEVVERKGVAMLIR